MAIGSTVRKATATIAAATNIAVTGIFQPSREQTSAETVSSYHRKRRSRGRSKRNWTFWRKSETATCSKNTDKSTDEAGVQVGDNAGNPHTEDTSVVDTPIVQTESDDEEHNKMKKDEKQDNNEQNDLEENDKEENGHEENDSGKNDDKESGNEENDSKKSNHEENENEEEDEDEDPLDLFVKVRKELDVGKLQQAAAMVRLHQKTAGKCENLSLTELLSNGCSISPIPKCGSYNLAYVITFSDGLRWIARVPGHGYAERWCDLDATKMETEYRTMQYIRSRTSIPIPEVFHFDTNREFAGAPFALMSFCEGRSIAEVWMDELPEPQRLDILSSVAGYMSQLYGLTFDSIGMLRFDDEGNPVGIGPNICLESFNFDHWHATRVKGPYAGSDSALWNLLDEDEDMHARSRAHFPILRRVMHTIPKVFTEQQKFPLNFVDFNFQNIHVDADHRITGFIDWDGVGTESVAIGCARYPSWITRDWDPIMYNYNEKAPLEGSSAYEDSPQTLMKYRQHYAAEFAKHAANFEGYDPRMTSMSQMLEAVRLAASDIFPRSEICHKFLDYAFHGKTPFTMFEYVNDFVEGCRGEKDGLMYAAFGKMWHLEWDESEAATDKDTPTPVLGVPEEDVEHHEIELEDQQKADDTLLPGEVSADGKKEDGLDVGEVPEIDAEDYEVCRGSIHDSIITQIYAPITCEQATDEKQDQDSDLVEHGQEVFSDKDSGDETSASDFSAEQDDDLNLVEHGQEEFPEKEIGDDMSASEINAEQNAPESPTISPDISFIEESDAQSISKPTVTKIERRHAHRALKAWFKDCPADSHESFLSRQLLNEARRLLRGSSTGSSGSSTSSSSSGSSTCSSSSSSPTTSPEPEDLVDWVTKVMARRQQTRNGSPVRPLRE